MPCPLRIDLPHLRQHVVRRGNDHSRGTVTLWEGRYKPCRVENDHHLPHCHRYIELNPVRGAMVADRAAFAHSSHRANPIGDPDPPLSAPAVPRARRHAHRAPAGLPRLRRRGHFR